MTRTIRLFVAVCMFAGIQGTFLLWGAENESQAPKKDGSSVSKGGLKFEHLAFAYASSYYLDGPRLEAACPNGRPGPGAMDEDENVWFGKGNYGGVLPSVGGRCLMKETGLIQTIFGDDYWTGYPDIDEGPDAVIATETFTAGLGQPPETWFVYGAPHQGGDKGFLLFSDGNTVRKVWKNAEKGNRWWFKKIVISGGKEPLPKTKGGTVNAREFKGRVHMVQAMPDGRIVLYADGGFYEYKDGTLVCLIGPEDYKDSLPADPKSGKPIRDLTMGVYGGDGTFYFGNYFGSAYAGKMPCIWRVVPGGRMEPYAWAPKQGASPNFDGPAMSCYAYCGMHFWASMHNYRYIPADSIFPTAHDQGHLRRIRNGRVSTIVPETGDWVESLKAVNCGWFKRCMPGPRDMVTAESAGSHKGYSPTTQAITYLLSNVDFGKETAGPPVEAPVLPWPPAMSGEKKEAK